MSEDSDVGGIKELLQHAREGKRQRNDDHFVPEGALEKVEFLGL